MSSTIIYAFNNNGDIVDSREFRNAWAGAMFIWNSLEKKYSLSCIADVWNLADSGTLERFERTALYTTFDRVICRRKDFEEVADALETFSRTFTEKPEKPTLPDTPDPDPVKSTRDQLNWLIDLCQSLEKARGNDPELTNLENQAAYIRSLPEEIGYIGWNQTSVCGDDWSNCGGEDIEENEDCDDEDDEDLEDYEPIPYNVLTGTRHFFLETEIGKQ